MAAPQVFRVLTEFRFEIGSAVASTDALTKSVDKVSNAADNALISFQRLSLGIVASFLSGPGGGVLGVLGTALRISDKFTQSQIALANVMGRSSGTFQQRMAFAEKSMERIGKLASATGISGEGLIDFTKLLTPVLAPKVGGKDAVKQSAELGRVFLKSAPSLGVEQATGIGQLRRLVTGLDAAGNDLFTILTQDTKAMKEFAGQGKKFQNLDISKRMKILTSAFGQFANETNAVTARVETMSGQFLILKENLIGTNSVLRKLGRTLTTVVVQALKRMNNIISGPIREIFDNIAFGLEPLVNNFEKLIATLMQARGLKADVGGAGDVVFNIATLLGIREILKLFKIDLPFVTKFLNKVHAGVMALESPFLGIDLSVARFMKPKLLTNPFVNLFSRVMPNAILPIMDVGTRFALLLDKITIFASRVLSPLLLLTLVFQILTRTAAFIKINMVEKIEKLGVSLSKTAAKALRAFSIFNDGMDNMARMLSTSPLVDFMFFVAELTIQTFDFMVVKVVQAMAAIQGLTNAIGQLFMLANLNKDAVRQATLSKEQGGSGGIFNSIKDAFNFGTDQIFERVFGKIENGEAVSNKVTNVNVKMNNNFKEVLQPDRIAFTISDQLSKLAQNPRGASGASFKPFGKVTQ